MKESLLVKMPASHGCVHACSKQRLVRECWYAQVTLYEDEYASVACLMQPRRLIGPSAASKRSREIYVPLPFGHPRALLFILVLDDYITDWQLLQSMRHVLEGIAQCAFAPVDKHMHGEPQAKRANGSEEDSMVGAVIDTFMTGI